MTFSSVQPRAAFHRDITIFDSTGLAIQDLAIALAAMEQAEELDLPNFDLYLPNFDL